MGFSSGRFLHPPDPNLLCAVCGGVLHQAVTTPCGHSFCSPCLHTWLATCHTCPECRAQVTPALVKPVHALRNLVRGLRVRCEHSEHGCQEELTLEQLPHHLPTCPHHPVACARCGLQVPKLGMPGHDLTCPAGVDPVGEGKGKDVEGKEGEGEGEGEGLWLSLRRKIHGTKPLTPNDVSLMLGRIRALETRADHLFQELKCARSKTLALERELGTLTGHVPHKLQRPLSHHYHHHPRDVRPNVRGARTPETIGELSLLIARHLLQKPREVEAERVFRAIARCYDDCHRSGPEGRHDVHMLLATAFASNWFCAAHRSTLHRWLKTLH